MVFYFSSPTYQPMISKVLNETDQIVAGKEVGEEIFFRKYIKENIRVLEQVDLLILNLNALADTEEEIKMSLESLMIMDYKVRIIILAPMRPEGDPFLKNCFYMGIYDIINTDEYLKIHEELTLCITTGMKYKDALRFRVEEIVEKAENKALQKILIGITSTGEHMGCTHNSILLANFLREKNYMVALAEGNASGAFEKIRESKNEPFYEDGYFSIKGVDFYPSCSREKLPSIAGRIYNFILLDLGNYYHADKLLLNKCDVKVIITGSKPWEVDRLTGIFQEQDEVVLKNYHFCFLFAASNRKLQNDIRKSMEPLDQIYFPEYTEDPFDSHTFSEGYAILKDYIPTSPDSTPKEERPSWMVWRRKKIRG